MIVIALEPFDRFYEHGLALLHKHKDEIATYPDIDLDVDIARYQGAERAGMLRVFTARKSETEELVGYALFFVTANAHYRRSLQAVQDVLYVAQNARGALLGRRLIRHCDAVLKAEGVQVVTQHVKLAHPALGRIAELEGYAPIETIYAKRLDREGT